MSGSKMILGGAVLAMSMLLSGCANDFEAHFVGERAPETDVAEIVPWGPVPEGKRQLGHSAFLSTRDEGDREALAAARALGAEAVAWRRSWKRDTQHTGYDSITHTDRTETKGNVGGVPFSSTSTVQRTESRPYQYTLRWFQYEARFFRAASKSPPVVKPVELRVPEVP